jgi:putative tryptophan/tyrosine transport system substrate-binding protein
MRRREFVAGLGGAAAWPLAGRGQQALPVIGYLGPDVELPPGIAAAFQQGLSETGYRNAVIEYRRSTDGDELATLAAETVVRRVNVIFSVGVAATAFAIKASAGTIPIVFSIGPDPVKLGFVASLSHPGGNVTGFTNLNPEMVPKRLDLLHAVLPAATTIALLDNPTNPGMATQTVQMAAQTMQIQAIASGMGITLPVLHAGSESELEAAFGALRGLNAGGLIIGADGFFYTRPARLAALAIRHHMPAIFMFREFATAGGLMSYGTSLADSNRVAGIYAGRILKGEQPCDLPVQQATKFEFVINLKAAKALGLSVPTNLLAIADEVIEE